MDKMKTQTLVVLGQPVLRPPSGERMISFGAVFSCFSIEDALSVYT
jgi:hypothetical protein